MRVAIDTNGLYTTQAGVARYIRGLIKGIGALGLTDVDWFEFGWKVQNFEYRQPQRALKTAYRELVWRTFIAPRTLGREKADLLHSTVGYFVRPPARTPVVATLHDAAVLRFPLRFRRWQRHSGRRSLKTVRLADRIICISRFTADEGIELLGLDPRRIEVVYEGCDFHPDQPCPGEEKPAFSVPAEFFLFVGSLEPGKNLSLLRESYQLAEQQGRRLPPLMIVGARWAGVEGEGKPPNDWHYLGRQPDSVLIYLYRRALGLVFPSKYEGFGLPVVEAMTLGCPVICSPVASLTEVGEGAALFTDLNPEAYATVMHRLTREDDLRKQMSEQGKIRSRSFSWRKCALETVGVYRRVVK